MTRVTLAILDGANWNQDLDSSVSAVTASHSYAMCPLHVEGWEAVDGGRGLSGGCRLLGLGIILSPPLRLQASPGSHIYTVKIS